MSSPLLLEVALNNASVPHQPYILVSDEPTFGGVPLIREMIRRSMSRQAPTLLVSVLRSPSTYLPTPSGASSGSSVEIIDLTDRIPSYDQVEFEDIKTEVLQAVQRLGPKVEIFIDAIDVFAEDHTPAGALTLVRGLLKQIKSNKAPSRLTLLSSPHSKLYPSLLPPSLSASLTQLHPHPLPLLSALSIAYLAPISAEPRFCDLLDMAAERHLGERMAWLGESSLGDWTSGTKSQGSNGANKGKTKGIADGQQGVAAVQVIVRKATGGAKGMSRSLEGLVLSTASSSGSTSILAGSSSAFVDLVVKPLDAIIDLTPFSHPASPANQAQTPVGDSRSAAPAPTVTHTALNLPFNLSLTDEQRRRRDRVPIPYVHEGEGVEVGWEEEEDDEDDEEI